MANNERKMSRSALEFVRKQSSYALASCNNIHAHVLDHCAVSRISKEAVSYYSICIIECDDDSSLRGFARKSTLGEVPEVARIPITQNDDLVDMLMY